MWFLFECRFRTGVGQNGAVRRPLPILCLFVLLAACGVEGAQADPTLDSRPSSTTASVAPTSTTVAPTTIPQTAPATTTTTTEPLAPLRSLELELVADGLPRPTLVLAPRDDARRFVVLQGGRVVILDDDGVPLADPFLDLSDEVNDNGIEQGLLGMAFHPDYAQNGRLFVYYSVANNDTRLVELHVADDPNRVDPSTAETLLEIVQPTDRHNAGMIQFGPDGYLYLSLGEGGAAAENAQNSDTVLGSIIRLDVDSGAPYTVPADNPFVDGAAPEVWAIGLRNPWRFAIDAATDTMFIADVGHSDWEEINAVPLAPAGYNFGWLAMEGTHCFQAGCDPAGMILPIVEYGHSEGCSVSGGFVYRGADIPEINGHYFYGDWCGGWIRSFRLLNGVATDERDWTDELGSPGQVTSFGTDARGELYVTTWDGSIFKLAASRE